MAAAAAAAGGVFSGTDGVCPAAAAARGTTSDGPALALALALGGLDGALVGIAGGAFARGDGGFARAFGTDGGPALPPPAAAASGAECVSLPGMAGALPALPPRTFGIFGGADTALGPPPPLRVDFGGTGGGGIRCAGARPVRP